MHTTKFSAQRFFAALLIVLMLTVSAAPAPMAFADEDTGTTTDSGSEEVVVPGCMDPLAENFNTDATESDDSCTYAENDEDETGTSTDETAGGDDTGTSTEETATSTDEAAEGDTGTTTATSTPESGPGDDGQSGNDGVEGPPGGDDGNPATTTATSTGDGTDGEETGDGTGGSDGDGAPATTTEEVTPEEDEDNPFDVISENEIGDDATPEDSEDVTGSEQKTGRNTLIETGNAKAQGEIFSDINSNNVKSEIELPLPNDLDNYIFSATGTNEALVETDGAVFSLTGENTALATGVGEVRTGSAISAFNVANIVNSNVVNSEGFFYLKNEVLEPDASLDLSDFFFPDEDGLLAGANDCDFLSCFAEDIHYNFSQESHATVTNDGTIEAITGDNFVDGDLAEITTGDAYGAANVINLVNTNIVDSNYRLLTLNAIGDLEGDLKLPRAELFKAFFGKPNAMAQVVGSEGAEHVHVSVDNDNLADVENNLDAYAETGLNEMNTTFDGAITTGNAESESNILDKINQNTFGGDSMYLLIRVHGYWDGLVHGLPEGLAYEWTPDGVIIFNEGAEIEPSEVLPYDVDSYNANFENLNRVHIENNLTIDAITGMNEADGLVGEINTGNAFASANVMNIANTNVVGSNWTMAVINIFGDFDGNVTFTETDLALEGVQNAGDEPLAPGAPLSYDYTITNNSTVKATGVILKSTLQNGFFSGTDNEETASLGTIDPGQSKQVTFTAFVDPNLPAGSHTVTAVAEVDSNESDENSADNAAIFTAAAFLEGEATTTDSGTGTTTGTTTDPGDTGTTTDPGDTGTTTDPGTDEEDDDTPSYSQGSYYSQASYGGGGGGGNDDDDDDAKAEVLGEEITREQEEIDIDPTDPPHIVVLKQANFDSGRKIKAGQEVDYTIFVINQGGAAFDASVYDTLTNANGSAVSEQSWELGTVLPGEKIELNYTTLYNAKTPSGIYTNTASIEAYRYEGDKAAGKEPLSLKDSEHTIEIDGVDLAVGNVQVLAYFPAGDGTIGALVSWETSKPAWSQVFYSRSRLTSPFNALLPNYGYEDASFRFDYKKTKHAMILFGLRSGTSYTYRIHAETEDHEAFGGDYHFNVPVLVSTLTLAFPTAKSTSQTVGGGTPAAPSPTSVPAAPATPSATAPAPVKVASAPAESAPTPEPEPEPDPEPQDEGGGVGGFVKGAASKVFGFFR